MPDPYRKDSPELLISSDNPVVFTPHDTNEVPFIPKAISVNVSGIVRLRGAGATADCDIYIAAGVPYPVRARFIRATGTTATGITLLA
jgi:hypothetical protein